MHKVLIPIQFSPKSNHNVNDQNKSTIDLVKKHKKQNYKYIYYCVPISSILCLKSITITRAIFFF